MYRVHGFNHSENKAQQVNGGWTPQIRWMQRLFNFYGQMFDLELIAEVCSARRGQG